MHNRKIYDTNYIIIIIYSRFIKNNLLARQPHIRTKLALNYTIY